MLATLPEYPWNNALHTAVVNRSQLGLRLAWVGAGAVPEENIGGGQCPLKPRCQVVTPRRMESLKAPSRVEYGEECPLSAD